MLFFQQSVIGNARKGAQKWPNKNIFILLIYCKLYSVLLVSVGMLNVLC